MSDKSLPNWLKTDKKRFDGIKKQIQSAKDRPERVSLIYFDESSKLI